MNSQSHSSANGDKQQPDPSTSQKTEQESVQISLPKTDRAEGPFEHSGETARQTAAEAEEKAQQS